MAQSVSIDTKTVARILSELDKLRKDMAAVKDKLFDKEPRYGSDEWWDWSDKKAMEDIKAGRYTIVRDAKELKTHLDALKKS